MAWDPSRRSYLRGAQHRYQRSRDTAPPGTIPSERKNAWNDAWNDAWREEKPWDTLWLCQQFAIENGSCIVELPIKNSDFPLFFVCLPEGTMGPWDQYAAL